MGTRARDCAIGTRVGRRSGKLRSRCIDIALASDSVMTKPGGIILAFSDSSGDAVRNKPHWGKALKQNECTTIVAGIVIYTKVGFIYLFKSWWNGGWFIGTDCRAGKVVITENNGMIPLLLDQIINQSARREKHICILKRIKQSCGIIYANLHIIFLHFEEITVQATYFRAIPSKQAKMWLKPECV